MEVTQGLQNQLSYIKFTHKQDTGFFHNDFKVVAVLPDVALLW